MLWREVGRDVGERGIKLTEGVLGAGWSAAILNSLTAAALVLVDIVLISVLNLFIN